MLLGQLGDEELGSHPRNFQDTDTYKGVCAFVGDIPVGYGTYSMLLENSPEWEEFHKTFGQDPNRNGQPVGQLKSLVVNPRYRNCGIGRAITKNRLSRMNWCNWVGVACWLSSKGVMASGILENEGFSKVSVLKNYWKNGGVPCPECGAICLCSAVLYVRKNESLSREFFTQTIF